MEFADGTVWTAAQVTEAGRTVYGTAGNDTIYGGVGVNIINGGDGNDLLANDVVETSSTLIGGAGNDTLRVEFWTNANTFEGGTGNDNITGGYSADTYRFNLGDGQDIILDNQSYTTGGMNTDRLVFGAGIAASDITAQRSGNDMVLRHVNGTDQITVQNWFTNNQYVIERVEFADGTVWTAAQVTEASRTVYGTSGNDTMYGGVGVNIMNGLGGDDLLANDNVETSNTLLGGAGNDTLRVTFWTNANTFEGGTGNDNITGGYSADTYRFNLGDGQDIILDNQSYTAGGMNTDRLVFGAGIAASDITARRSGNDMVFSHGNGTDRITVRDWFQTNGQYVIERVEFADGTVWTAAQVTEAGRTVYGTAGNDTIYGGVGVNIINGGDGNDLLANDVVETSSTLIGGAGNDTLRVTFWTNANTFEGGTGNDNITGGYNNDTYRFNLGDGQDIILDNQSYTTGGMNTDRLVFGAGIAASDITAQRSGNDMVLRHVNGTDQITVQNWFTNNQYVIERVEFADGTVWTAAQVTEASRTVYGTSGNDTMYGGVGVNIMNGLGGDDLLANDNVETSNTLLGGAGNDTLRVTFWTNANTFEGGAGNDNITGGYSADTYRFNLGDGQDAILDQPVVHHGRHEHRPAGVRCGHRAKRHHRAALGQRHGVQPRQRHRSDHRARLVPNQRPVRHRARGVR